MTDELTTYIVQVQEQVDVEPDEVREGWFDLATVTVPARTKRRSVIARALEQTELKLQPGEATLKVRVLSAGSAHVSEVTAEARDPQLRIA